MKTFIRWSGNKSRYLKHILSHIPPHFGTYYEPFTGSGALFLYIAPPQWVLNDMNTDLINIWLLVRNDPKFIIKGFKRFNTKFKSLSQTEKVSHCRKLTNQLNILPFGPQRAINFILMKFCAYMSNILIDNKFYFNGLDINIQRSAKYHFLDQPYYDNLLEISTYLNKSNGVFHNKDYKAVLKLCKRNDFVFLDPPYVEEHNYRFNYNQGETLDQKFLQELLQEVQKLDRKNVKWLMTQADTKDVRSIFNSYNIIKYPVYRPSTKTWKNELIIKNY